MVVIDPPHFSRGDLLEPKDSGGQIVKSPNFEERTIRFLFMGGTTKQQGNTSALQFLV